MQTPRKEQAIALAADGWPPIAIAAQLGVTVTTATRWLNPEYERRQKQTRLAWEKTPAGRENRRRYRERAAAMRRQEASA